MKVRASVILQVIRVTKLRSRNRATNGMTGEESLEHVVDLNSAPTCGFLWEARSIDGDITRPCLSLALESRRNWRQGGKPVEATLSQCALLALWDGIASGDGLHSEGRAVPFTGHGTPSAASKAATTFDPGQLSGEGSAHVNEEKTQPDKP